MRIVLTATIGSQQGKSFVFENLPIVIGRAPDSNLPVEINDTIVSTRHCVLFIKDGEFCVQDFKSRNGTFLNGRKVQDYAPVMDGALLRLGRGGPEFKVSMHVSELQEVKKIGGNEATVTTLHKDKPEPISPTPASKPVQPSTPVTPAQPPLAEEEAQTIRSRPLIGLLCQSGPDAGKMVEFARSQISIGRSNESQVKIQHDVVSSEHCLITFEDGQFIIKDLKSTNGTWVNDKEVLDPRALCDGDVIEVGYRGPKYKISILGTGRQAPKPSAGNVPGPKRDAPFAAADAPTAASPGRRNVPVNSPNASAPETVTPPRGTPALPPLADVPTAAAPGRRNAPVEPPVTPPPEIATPARGTPALPPAADVPTAAPRPAAAQAPVAQPAQAPAGRPPLPPTQPLKVDSGPPELADDDDEELDSDAAEKSVVEALPALPAVPMGLPTAASKVPPARDAEKKDTKGLYLVGEKPPSLPPLPEGAGRTPPSAPGPSHEVKRAPPPPLPVEPIVLTCSSGSLAGKRFEFREQSVMVGRAKDCNITFDPHKDIMVSSHHCELSVRDGRWMLRDLDSKGGTLLNKKSVGREWTAIPDGATIKLGKEGPAFGVNISMSAVQPARETTQSSDATIISGAVPVAEAAVPEVKKKRNVLVIVVLGMAILGFCLLLLLVGLLIARGMVRG